MRSLHHWRASRLGGFPGISFEFSCLIRGFWCLAKWNRNRLYSMSHKSRTTLNISTGNQYIKRGFFYNT
jgi:hypothetical protein